VCFTYCALRSSSRVEIGEYRLQNIARLFHNLAIVMLDERIIRYIKEIQTVRAC